MAQERSISATRNAMREPREGIKRGFYITLLDRAETWPPHPYLEEIAGKERKIDSNWCS